MGTIVTVSYHYGGHVVQLISRILIGYLVDSHLLLDCLVGGSTASGTFTMLATRRTLSLGRAQLTENTGGTHYPLGHEAGLCLEKPKARPEIR
jgi:hypothetical protein